MRIKIIDPKGVINNGSLVPKGEVIDAGGPQLKAWLHFKQAVPAESNVIPGDFKNPPAGTKADHEKAAAEKAKADAAAQAEKEAQEKSAARATFKAKTDARGAELKKLNRKSQLALAEKLGLKPDKDAKEEQIISQILEAELGPEAKALGLQ